MTRPRAFLLTIGDELLSGDVVDANKAWLAQRCRLLGVEVVRATTVRDREDEIVAAIHVAGELADICLVSGGLGPTTDDLTREAVAEYFQVGLFVDQSELQKQMKRYADRGKEFPISNTKQATFPVSAEIIKNNFG